MKVFKFSAGWNMWVPYSEGSAEYIYGKGWSCALVGSPPLLHMDLYHSEDPYTFIGAKIYGQAPCGPGMDGLQVSFHFATVNGSWTGGSWYVWTLNDRFTIDVPPSGYPPANNNIHRLRCRMYPRDTNGDQMGVWTNLAYIYRIDLL